MLLLLLLSYTLTLVDSVTCDSTYGYHLQGMVVQGGSVYWSFGVALVKTDRTGTKSVVQVVPMHYGGITYKDGRVFIAYSGGKVAIHDTTDLSTIDTLALNIGASSMGYHADTFAFASGQSIFFYDTNWVALDTAIVNFDCGTGIEAIAHIEGHWWVGSYTVAYALACLGDDLMCRYRYPSGSCLGSLGITYWNTDTMVIGHGTGGVDNYGGRMYLYEINRNPIRARGGILGGCVTK